MSERAAAHRGRRNLAFFVLLSCAGAFVLALGSERPTSAGGGGTKRFSLEFEGGVQVDFAATPVGSDFYEVNGVARTPKQIVLSGTAVKEGPTMRFGLVLLNQVDDFVPVVWEFTLDIASRTGAGEFQHLVDDELEGTFQVGSAFAGAAGAVEGGSLFGSPH